MYQDNPAWVQHQRARWLRPSAHHFIRPDASRFMPPGAPRLLGKEAVRYFWPDAADDQRAQASERKHDIDLSAARGALMRLRREIAWLEFALKFQRHLHEKAYNPNQPRVPAGNPDGGQWTDGGPGQGRIRLAQVGGTITDADGRPYYRPGGHHEMPDAVHKKWNLQPETRKVFRDSTTGKVGATIRTTPDGVRQGNVWDGEGGLHLAYNQAVEELANRFMEDHGLRLDGSDMTPDQAWAILKQIRESEDPRIRDFNLNIRRIQRLKRLRGGDD